MSPAIAAMASKGCDKMCPALCVAMRSPKDGTEADASHGCRPSYARTHAASSFLSWKSRPSISRRGGTKDLHVDAPLVHVQASGGGAIG